MALVDCHTHTRFSFDASPDVTHEKMCEAAIAMGLSAIAFTDHYDVNGDVEGIYDPFSADEAFSAAMEAKEKTAQAIKTRGQRPLENGMTSKSTALYKTDVSKLSPAERAEIAKRVAKGEIISF